MSEGWIWIHTNQFTIFVTWSQLCEFDKFKVRINYSSQIHNFTQRKKESSKFHSEIQSNSLNSHNLIYSFWNVIQVLWTCQIQTKVQPLLHKFTIILNQKREFSEFKIESQSKSLNSHNLIYSFLNVNQILQICQIQNMILL